MVSPDAAAKAAKVRLLTVDVDGVLTDGSLYYGPNGDFAKRFSVRDGLGIGLAKAGGVSIALVTGKESDAVARRAETLGVRRVLQGVRDKGAALAQLAEELGLGPDEIGHIGDDLNDLPAFDLVGFRACPSDAADRVKELCHFCASVPGGRGAVRETIEFVLSAKGALGEAEARFVSDLKDASES
jgi:3-deoxy-D-manno-octulosonate 8-phosphate phosphatase (KDO 8-P phosphatase)